MELVMIESTDTFALVMVVTMAIIVRQVFDLFCLSYLYIYPPGLQESDGGANTYPDLLPNMSNYCFPFEI